MSKVQIVGASAGTHQSKHKKTSQSGKKKSLKLSSMNKHKKRSSKIYRGQG